ncbi:MAG: beta-ketoacyl-[acyl-carrier-protein] synthase family protein [Paludibacteraceae bacterium]|nr:beta-ketoacyl-[acyl-carrier-protein] synthase family protein [Paludibacteraceae bacterium]
MTIAITGIGIVSALGIGQSANRATLRQSESHVGSLTILPTRHRNWPAGEIGLTNEQLISEAHLNIPATYSRNTILGIMALQEALHDAGASCTTLINGTTVGNMDKTEGYYGAWMREDWTTIGEIAHHRAALHTRQMADYCGMTDMQTVSTACSSALNAIICGANRIRNGEVKCVAVGGVDSLTKIHWNGFASLGILSAQRCRPFQDDRDGINLGEGAAYLIIENAEYAKARGAHIYGYITGYCNGCDAYHPTASSPDGEGAYQTMRTSLAMAGLTPADIPYINAHGTATPNNDASELCAIQRLWGDQLPIIESTKPLTGHTTSASGSIEVIFCLDRMQEKGYHSALCNAFGFGGNDSTIIVEATTSQRLIAAPLNQQANCASPLRKTSHELFRENCKHIIEGPVVMSDGGLDYSAYLPPMQARRMTMMMRQMVAAARQAIEQAGMGEPDAIVLATQWGAMVPSYLLLDRMEATNEEEMSPSLFMMAANNALATTLARLIGCKGYNLTLMGLDDLWEQAHQEAVRTIQGGMTKRVLVVAMDEIADGWQQLLEKANCAATNIAQAQMITIC